MMNKQIFLGHLTMDDIIYSNGETHMGALGGATLYSAAGSCIWGDESYIISVVGNSYNYEKLRDISSKSKINIDYIHRVENHGIDIWVLYDKNNDHYFIPKYYSGSFDEIVPTCSMIPENFLDIQNIFHIAPMPIKKQKDLVTYLKSHNCIVTLDPHQESCGLELLLEWEYIFESINIFFPSELEFRLLSGVDPRLHLNEITRFARFYKIQTIVLKMADKGAYMYLLDSNELYHVPSIANKIVNYTGAGDAFAGGFVYSYIRNMDPVKSLGFATVSAAVVMESISLQEVLGKGGNLLDNRLEECLKSINRVL